jgi:hypothetical protein
MMKTLLDIRLNAVRHGDENSKANQEFRGDMLDLISAICEAIPITENGKISTIPLHRGYVVTKTFRAGANQGFYSTMRNRRINDGVDFYWTENDAERILGNMLCLEASRVIAKDVAKGWLEEVLKIIFSMHDGRDVALKLGEGLGLPVGK